ncbi:integrator complex subunit 5-like [Ornithodoros turicata]
MASVIKATTQSDTNTLSDLRLFLAGTAGYDKKIKPADVTKAAIRLLKTLPAARDAVLEYMHNLFDDAVNKHIMKLDTEETPSEPGEHEQAIEEVEAVLSGFIKSNLCAWAPIISTWSLDLLGYLASKYADRRIVHYSSSLQEVLEIWMACPPTRTLIDLTTQCLSILIGTNPDLCIDALLETCVKRSPHFDWVVAHIGSCFPNTVITRVLACGLKDFISHEDQLLMNAEKKVPKLASVVGILGHLAGQHAANIKKALVNLMQESFVANPTREQLATVPFLLQLASMSELLLTAIVSEFNKILSADVLNKLSGLVSQWEAAKIPGTKDLMSLVVVLILQYGTGDLKFLAHLLDVAAGEGEYASSALPVVQNAAGIILDNVLMELQHRVYAGAADIPLLFSLERKLPDLCLWMDTKSSSKTMWIWNVISFICIYSKEKTCINVLSHLLCRIRGGSELLLFQALVHHVEVIHINSLPSTVLYLMAELRSGRISEPQRLVDNLKKFCTNTQMGARVSDLICKSAEVLAEQMQTTRDFAYVDLLAELLMVTVQPEHMPPATIVKVTSSATAYFFTIVSCPEHYNGAQKFKAAVVCFKLLSTLCIRSVPQHVALRNLLSGVLDDRVSWLFGAVPKRQETEKLQPKFVSLLEENQKFATSINFPQSHSSILRIGVIGSGLRTAPVRPKVEVEGVQLNKQLFLEALTACCALPWRNGRLSSTKTSMVPGMKTVALLLVELVSSDVMFNGLPWPDEDFLKVTIERDLHINASFADHPILWDLLRLTASVRPSLCYCSVLLRAIVAVMMTHWRNSQEKGACNCAKQLETSRKVLQVMATGQLLPAPLSSIGQILHLLTPFEVSCLLSDVWQYMKDNVPSPALFAQKNGQYWREFKAGENGASKYTERLRMIMMSNISTCGPLFQKFFNVE